MVSPHPPSSMVVAVLAQRHPSIGAAPCSPVQWHPVAPHGTRLGRSGGTLLLSLRKGSRQTIILFKIKVLRVCMQNQSQAWNHGCPCDTGSGIPSFPHPPPSPQLITLDSSVRLFVHTALSLWMSDVNTCNICRMCGHLTSPSPSRCSSSLQQQPFAACHVTTALTSVGAAPAESALSLLLAACPFPYPNLLRSWGCSHRLPACRSSPPCAVCHRPSLRAVLLAKDTLWHSCLPPLLQSGRFVLLCTLLMPSSCRDPAPHRRSKWAETSTQKIIAMRAIPLLSCLESAYMVCVTAPAHRSSTEMQLATQLGDRQAGRHWSSV